MSATAIPTAAAVQRIETAPPPDAVHELILDVDLDDERSWVPRGDNVGSLPLLFSVTQRRWVNIRAAGRRRFRRRVTVATPRNDGGSK